MGAVPKDYVYGGCDFDTRVGNALALYVKDGTTEEERKSLEAVLYWLMVKLLSEKGQFHGQEAADLVFVHIGMAAYNARAGVVAGRVWRRLVKRKGVVWSLWRRFRRALWWQCTVWTRW